MWVPRHHQVAPAGDWLTWALIGGRGSGKTDGGAHYVAEHVKGPPCIAGRQPHRIQIVAPTLGDAVDACVSGPSGLIAHDPTARLVQATGGTYVRWPNGSEARLFGAFTPDDAERFRAGGNRCLGWWEEYAAWRLIGAVTEQATLGLRLGPHPRKIVTSTPKPKKALKDILADPMTVRTYTEDGRVPTMDDNPDLPIAIRDQLRRLYAGTRLGRQELGGELLEDVPGAFWPIDVIERNRVKFPGGLPGDGLRLGTPLEGRPMQRVVVAIDPAATSDDDSDETGIVAVGKAIVPAHPLVREFPNADLVHPDRPHPHFYVLADSSGRYSPTGWAQAAIDLLDAHGGDRIIGEGNNGGDMVESTIRTVRPTIAYRKVTASRGKDVRAEPISALYEQDLVHHVGLLPALEDQLTTYTGPDSIEHDDRMDAEVYGITDLHSTAVAFMAATIQHGRGPTMGRTGRRPGGYRDPRGTYAAEASGT